MKDYIYYTPPQIAQELLTLVPKRNYKTIVDICCGSWNLLNAAWEMFPNAKFTGVDVKKIPLPYHINNALFYCGDGRDFAINEWNRCSYYDLILSNPPFGYLEDGNRKFAHTKGTPIIPCLIKSHRYEGEMLQANLMLVEKGGMMVFILPSTLINGEKSKQIRCTLAKNYWIQALVELPLEAFGHQQISTYGVVIQNTTPDFGAVTEHYKMTLHNGCCAMHKMGTTHYTYILSGLWTGEKQPERKKKDVQSFRGNISSGQFTKTGETVLHCSSIMRNNQWYPSKRCCDDQSILSRCAKALPGDILVNRIGKRAGFWQLNREETYISDCLIAFRAQDKNALKKRFKEQSHNGQLNIAVKGVATRYVSASDILAII